MVRELERQIMNILSRYMRILFGLLVVIALIGCGGSDSKSENESVSLDSALAALEPMAADTSATIDYAAYENWEPYSLGTIRIMTPPSHHKKDELYDISKKYEATIRAACSFMDIPIPRDTLVVMYYTGPGQGERITGNLFMFVQNDTIHQWPPYHFGLGVMEYLIPRWIGKQSRFKFLKQGMMKLFDGSGRNYHKKTMELVDSSMFIPLRKLAVSDRVDARSEQLASAESASFVDYIVYAYGIQALKLMYLSQVDINATVNGIFGMTVNELEQAWLETAQRAAQ